MRLCYGIHYEGRGKGVYIHGMRYALLHYKWHARPMPKQLVRRNRRSCLTRSSPRAMFGHDDGELFWYARGRQKRILRKQAHGLSVSTNGANSGQKSYSTNFAQVTHATGNQQSNAAAAWHGVSLRGWPELTSAIVCGAPRADLKCGADGREQSELRASPVTRTRSEDVSY